MRRIVIEIFPNSEHIRLHCNFEISRTRLLGFFRSIDEVTDHYGNELKPEVIELRKDLYNIPGIDEAPGVDVYEVSLTKSPAFDWNQIVPLAVEHIAFFANANYGVDNNWEYLLKDSRPKYEESEGFYGPRRVPVTLPPAPDFGLPIRDSKATPGYNKSKPEPDDEPEPEDEPDALMIDPNTGEMKRESQLDAEPEVE